MQRKLNEDCNCKPITCTVMGGPPKSWSLAEHTGHLVQGAPLNMDTENNSWEKELKCVRNTKK